MLYLEDVPPRRSAIDARLDALYAELPDIKCKMLCADVCGVLPMSHRERQRIRERGVKITPRDEALQIYTSTGDYTCEALKDGKCTVYEIRPLVCRLWGLVRDVDSMRCQHGCIPERWLTNPEALRFVEESLRIGGGDGS